MTAIGASGDVVVDRARLKRPELGRAVVRDRARHVLDAVVAVWVVAGGLVFIEPSPYEIAFVGVLAMALVAGLGLYRSTLGLLAIFVGFIPFSLVAVFQVRNVDLVDALIFAIVTYFLLLTSYFVANYVAEAPLRRMKIIVTAYTVAAVISAVIGTLAYLQLMPASDLFVLYGRARAMFKDPNVFGPFLILPAMFALQRVLLTTGWRSALAAAIYFILFVGVFVSFSRAAWGHLAASSVLVVLGVFLLVATGRQKVRIMVLSLVGIVGIMVALAGLLSIPSVADLFAVRTASQDYDTGETGRFGRQGFAYALALDNPLGIGPTEFPTRAAVREDPHNTFVTVMLSYGWGGGVVYWIFLGSTVWISIRALTRPSPLRPMMIPLSATFLVLTMEAAIIDTDHWRHFFLIAGLIWGVNVAIRSGPQRLDDPKAAIL